MAATPVQKELEKIALDYRRFLALRNLSICWGATALAGFGLILIFRTFSWTVPHALAYLLLAAAAGAAAVFWRAGSGRLALREIARRIERDDPQLNTLLLAAIDQQPDPASGQLNFLQLRVIDEAVAANRQSPWNQKFAQRLFWAQAVHLVLLGAFFTSAFGLAVLVPPARVFGRVLTALEVTPGSVAVEKGTSLAVAVKFPGVAPARVELVYQTPSGGTKTVPMARSLSDPLFGFTLPELAETTVYRITYDGQTTASYTAEVFEYPELKRADAQLTHPAYTGLAPTRVEDTRRVTAVEGTGVEFTFFLNKPVRSARLIATNQVIALTNSAASAITYLAGFPLTNSSSYQLELIDREGRTNKLPSHFVLVSLENQRPKLTLQAPRGDQRVSALQEIRFEGQAQDDFGLLDYGLAYAVPGSRAEVISLAAAPPASTPAPVAEAKNTPRSKPHEVRPLQWLLPLEQLAAEPGQLVSYHLWAEDIGPDGQPRRTHGDMYFAEVRPFEEIFRQGSESSGQSEQNQRQEQSPASRLLDLQKEIITATWNLQRREAQARPSPAFREDAAVVRDSQAKALEQGEAMREELRDEKALAYAEKALEAMRGASTHLARSAQQNTTEPLPGALEEEQNAYQALLKLQAREFQVTRNRSRGGGGGGEGARQRAQRQLDQLELKEEQNRYESESQASPLQNPEQRETLQVLSRLKELARRQQDMSQRLQELQSALNEAKTEAEREKLERMLKRLQEEQQQIVQDMDELRQRMAQPENQSRMAEARQQLDQTRQNSRQASNQLDQGNVGQALSSSARAERELQQLADQFRKSSSNQFTEEMSSLRQAARELEKMHEETARELEATKETQQRSLGDSLNQEVTQSLARQRAGLTNLLQNLRQVTEQSEAAEPLLSRQLYETLRRSSQSNPERILETASQLAERNLLPQAAELHQRAEPTIRALADGVEQAARGVLGDEQESLRFAERELRDLTERVQRELNRAQAADSNSASDATNADQRTLSALLRERSEQNATNDLAAASGSGAASTATSTNRAALARLSEQGESQPGNPSENGRERGQPGQPGESAESNESGQPSPGSPSPGQAGTGSENSQNPGENPGSGQGNSRLASNEAGAEGGTRGGGGGSERDPAGRTGDRPENGRERGGQAGPRRLTDQGGRESSGFGNGAGGGLEGPLTGQDFVNWSDRMRDLEEVLPDPTLRNEIARVRDRARAMRTEVKRHATDPRWDLVETELINPLRILQNRVAEQLARQGAREAVVPVDRDPVPQKYADLVDKYYEKLGRD